MTDADKPNDPNEILSQDEIDSLLNGVENDEVDTSSQDKALTDDDLRYYDFAAQERNVSGRLSGLLAINERFSRNFRTSLMGLLRRGLEVSSYDIKTIKVSEYFASMGSPACLNVMRMRPLIGSGLVYMGSKLVIGLVDSLFGGAIEIRDAMLGEKTEFTQMEIRIVNLVMDLLYKDLSKAWHPVLELTIEGQGFETNPNLLNIAGPNEMIVVKKFVIEFENLRDEVHVSMPYAMIEPIRSTLEVGSQGETADVNERWATALREEVFDAPLELTGDLATWVSTLREILKMKAGDVIPIDMCESVTVLANGLPTFRGKYGMSGTETAIKILGRVQRS